MQFQRLDATFGKLERRSLAFRPGLNVIEAPNESGKSTLAAFLRVMLYGLPTRDRGALADKNRYAPWTGSPMQGTLELSTEDLGCVTLRRDTVRVNAPMGRFSATYTGTGNEIAALTAADCGETLIGVPREVYERSAFIRQSGLAVDSSAELERRVAALITTGEEGVSYSEAAAALKKQLNARKSNARNGEIPVLEREIEAAEATRAELSALRSEQSGAEASLAELRETEANLRADLKKHELADQQELYAVREQAKRDAESAERETRMFRRMLTDAHAPPREVLEENQSRLRAADDLARQQNDAEALRRGAETALINFDTQPHKGRRRLAALLLAGAILLFVIPLAAYFVWHEPPAVFAAWAVAALLIVLFARESKAVRLAGQRRDELEASLREAEAACAALKAAREKTLALVYAAIPAGDAVSANTYVRETLARYDMLARLEAEARSKRQRCGELPKPELRGVPALPVERPTRGRAELQYELDRTAERRAEAQSRADYTAGRLQALGDAGELEAALAEKRERLAEARAEYEAISLAMETLEHANIALQNRFSPELGKRAAEYFSALTGGKYDAVALDRAFHALATETGESVVRDAALLSQGASDQLYLAVRLAICDMVLPGEKRVPLVLDDALIKFDDERCAAALELLLKAAETRQILLLTCQRREAAYISGRENANILTL